MSLRLGIDTGGTFTDAVLLDAADRVVASAKALTTRDDLARGIGEAVRKVRTAVPGPVGLVSLSTTLATNAIVEGRGGRAALVLVGLDEAALRRGGLDRALADTPVVLAAGGHRADGTEQAPLDRAAVEAAVALLAGEVEAFAVCSQFAVRNPAHERAVAAIATAAGRPATCSHELTARLDAPRRALTTLLNARLLPEIAALLDAVAALLQAEAIDAPVMVVTGDGSLLAAGAARQRPVETILSGPAASVVGAAFLAGLDEALVADVGGTTTDIAVLRGGRPRLSASGAVVGGLATMVEAIEVHTSGLGGDSEVRRDPGGGLRLGPRRVVPLSLLAHRHPAVLAVLTAQAARPRGRQHDAAFALRRRDPAAGILGPSASRLWELLAAGPQPLEEVIDRAHLGLPLRQLEARGYAIAAGFTPSDAAHVLGLQQGWSVEAARLGALLVGRLLFPDEEPAAETIAARVLERAGLRTAELLLGAALAAEGEPADAILDGPARSLVARALAGDAAGLVRPRLELGLPVVAVGGPAPIFYPLPAERLATRLVIPPHHATGNAVGAVVGRVERRALVLATGSAEDTWTVHLADGPRAAATLDDALALAEAAARDAALALAAAAGAPDAAVALVRQERAWDDAGGQRRVLDVEVVATATGRPRIATPA
ncbi:MAG: hydantoinase/oxoprolinase family protein [Geminicoccaceae bacterium]